MSTSNIVDLGKERANRDQLLQSSRMRGGGGPPDPPDLPGRVDRLERDLRQVRDLLVQIEPKIDQIHRMALSGVPELASKLSGVGAQAAAIEVKVNELEKVSLRLDGRVSQVPTLPQLIAVVMSVFAGAIALIAMTIAIVRYSFGS